MLGVPLESSLLDLAEFLVLWCEFGTQECRSLCELIFVRERAVVSSFGMEGLGKCSVGIPTWTRFVWSVKWMRRHGTAIDEVDAQSVLDWFNFRRIDLNIVFVVGMRYRQSAR